MARRRGGEMPRTHPSLDVMPVPQPRSIHARRTLASRSPRASLGALPLLALLASMACAGSGAPTPTPAPTSVALATTGPRKIEVLFLGHDAEHHTVEQVRADPRAGAREGRDQLLVHDRPERPERAEPGEVRRACCCTRTTTRSRPRRRRRCSTTCSRARASSPSTPRRTASATRPTCMRDDGRPVRQARHRHVHRASPCGPTTR